MLARSEEHRLEPLAGLLLRVAALGQAGARGAELGGEVVAQLLELAEVEEPRPAAAGGDTGVVRVDHRVREGRDDRLGQILLEPGDLPAQRAACSQDGRVVDDVRVRGPLVLFGDDDHETLQCRG